MDEFCLLWIIIHLIYVLFTNSEVPENFYKAACWSQISSQQGEYVHVPVFTVHGQDEDPSLLIPNLCPQPECAVPAILEGRFRKGRVSGTVEAGWRHSGRTAGRGLVAWSLHLKSIWQELTWGKQQLRQGSWGEKRLGAEVRSSFSPLSAAHTPSTF